MAHALHIENGRASMMFVRQTPWHGLGTRLESPPTSAEAITAAQLDWRVKKVPLYAGEGSVLAPLKHRFAVVPEHRWGSAECPILGVVGTSYTPLQNSDAFAFFDSIVGMNEAVYDTAGALGAGERVWILAKLPGEIRVAGEDVSEKYLLLSNGHDGNTAVRMKFTPVRVVCQNTLSIALASDDSGISVHHGWNFWRRMCDAREALGVINLGFARIATDFKQMASVQVSEERLRAYFLAVFPDPQSENRKLKLTAERKRSAVRRLFETGPGNDAKHVKGTLWAAFNGVTDYVDHYLGDYTPSQRLQSVWFGKGYQLKIRAFEAAKTFSHEWAVN